MSVVNDVTGSLVVGVANGISRALLPTQSLYITSFSVRGEGPAGQSFETDSAEWSYAYSGLAPGLWNVTVEAFNAGLELIGEESTEIEVLAGQVSSLYIELLPLTGDGTLEVDLSWDPETTYNPELRYFIAPVGVTADYFELEFSTEGIAVLESTLPSGYYVLSLSLLDRIEETDSLSQVYGGAELVRILSGQTTTGSIDLAELNPLAGSILQFLAWQSRQPLVLEYYQFPVEARLPYLLGETVELGVVPDESFSNAEYTWMVNGTIVQSETGPTMEFSSELALKGRADLFVFDPDSGRYGHASFELNWQ